MSTFKWTRQTHTTPAMTALISFPLDSSFPGAFLQEAPYPAWLKTEDGLCIVANETADRLMGRHIVGQTTEELFGDDAPMIREYERAALRNGFDRRVQTVNGHLVIVTRYRIIIHGRAFVAGIATQAKLSPLPV